MKRLGEIILVLIIATLACVVFTYPAINHISAQYIGDGGDNYEYASYMGLLTKQIHDHVIPLSHTNFWRYPVGIDFARSFDSYLTLFIGTAFTLSVGLPLSYNLTIYALLILNGLLSYFYFKKISHSPLLSIIGMLAYGFSFYVLARSNAHPNLMFIGGFPLSLIFLLRLIEKPSLKTRDFLYFFLSLIFITLGSMQYLLLEAIFLTVIIICSLIFYFQQSKTFFTKLITYQRQMILASLTSGVLFLIIFLPQVVAFIQGNVNFSNRSDTLAFATPGIDDFFLPNTYLHLLISPLASAKSKMSIETMVFLGWVEMLFFVIFLWQKNISKKFKGLLLTIFLVLFVLALGYGTDDSFFLLPYHFLKQFSLFAAIAETGRYFVVFYLVFISAILLGLVKLKNHQKTFYILSLILLFGIILERIPLSFRTVPVLTNQKYIQVVKNTPAKAVLDIPIDIYTPVYNILSLGYNKPIVNGYFHWLADGPQEKSFLSNQNLLLQFTCSNQDPLLKDPLNYPYASYENQLMQTLINNGITTIIVHRNSNYLFSNCRNVRIRLDHLIPFEQPLQLTSKQVEYSNSIETSQPSFTFYFPYSGKFYLDGTFISTRGNGYFQILQNYQPATFKYTWNVDKKNNYAILSPKDTIKFNVNAGDHLTIYSSNLIDYTFLSLWYRYVADPNTAYIPFAPKIQRIYQDNSTIVYTIKTNE